MTPQEIRDILDKSGYLFEQQIASVIENLGFDTVTNKAFLDEQENKSREMDIVAHKTSFKIEGSDTETVTGLIYLNCECKNSSTPYVFITRKKGALDDYYIPDGIVLAYSSYHIRKGDKSESSGSAFYYLGLDKLHYATRTQDKAVQVCKIIRNQSKYEAQHSGIIESFIYPLIKSMRVWKKNSPDGDFESKYCKFFYNIVVVNSKLYTIDSEIANSLPVEAKFVPFIREVHTQEMKGKFLITFVDQEHLEEFIKTEVNEFSKRVCTLYNESPELIRGSTIFL